MFIFDKRLLNTTRVNQLIIPKEDEETGEISGYVYLSLPMYQQAFMLQTIYEGDRYALESFLQLDYSHNSDIVDFFVSEVPEPINMLGVFLNLIEPTVKLEKDLTQLFKYINEMSKLINFRTYSEIPKEARLSIKMNNSQFLNMEANYREELLMLRERLDSDVEDVSGITVVTNEEITRVSSFVQLVSDSFGISSGGGYSRSSGDYYKEPEKTINVEEMLDNPDLLQEGSNLSDVFTDMFSSAFDATMDSLNAAEEKLVEQQKIESVPLTAQVSQEIKEDDVDLTNKKSQIEAKSTLQLISEAAGEEEEE